MAVRLKDRYLERNYACVNSKVQLHNSYASSENRENRYQHGCW